MVEVAETGYRGRFNASPARRRAAVRLAVGFAAVALILTGVFDAAEWYADRVALPRYCGDPDTALDLVRQTLSTPGPARRVSARSQVVAAKLIYLVPQRAGEPVAGYLARLRLRIAASCG